MSPATRDEMILVVLLGLLVLMLLVVFFKSFTSVLGPG
jgi:hypothetical protein